MVLNNYPGNGNQTSDNNIAGRNTNPRNTSGPFRGSAGTSGEFSTDRRLGSNPFERQTEAFSNTQGRGNYFGMNNGQPIEPDQTPSLSAIEDKNEDGAQAGSYTDNQGYYDDFGEPLYDEDEYEEDENGHYSENDLDNENNNSAANQEKQAKARRELKQLELRAKEKGSDTEDGYMKRLANAQWINIQKKLQIQDTIEKAKEIMQEGGHDMTSDEIIDAAQKPRETVSFPLEIFLMAVIKDILDMPTELGVATTVLGQIISTIIGGILMIWTFGKVSGWFGYKKRLVRGIFRRLAATVIVEFIPFIRILPANTVFVLMAHYHEAKFVKLLNLALDTIHDKKILKTIERLSKASQMVNRNSNQQTPQP